MLHRYSSAAALFVFTAFALTAAPVQAQSAQGAESVLTVFLQGSPIGSERVTVSSSADGWLIKGSGRLNAPLNLITQKVEVEYDRDWKPRRLEIEGSIRGQPLIMKTTFSGTSAVTEGIQGGQPIARTDTVSPSTLVLPNMFFVTHEALAQRLSTAAPGAELRVYVVPQLEVTAKVTGVTEERIQVPGRTIVARRFDVTFVNPNGPVATEVWIDQHGRLLRFRVAAQGLEVARDDVASVAARVERLARAGDEQVMMRAQGFSLAGTLSRPAGTTAPAPKQKKVPKLPAVILVPGSGPVDRDETVAGIAVFAQLANAIADAGFLVVRYDKRGVGQSGGRSESVTIEDYAEDLRAIIAYLRDRKDVDDKRIAIVGHSEGGLVGMIAAARDTKKVAALALVATPATTGADLVLEQQKYALDRMSLPDAEKQSRIDLQGKIQTAVITGEGWETIPAQYRRSADTPWFRSFLMFDPASTAPKLRAPVLIVQAERDRQVALPHGQRLLDLVNTRKHKAPAELFVGPGLNHLLVPAPTGDVTEYLSLTDKNLSPAVLSRLTSWLKTQLPESVKK